MKVELSAAAKDAIRNVLPHVDANKWSKVYNQFYEWTYKDIQHPLKAFEIGQITKFFEQNCGLNILSETKIIFAFVFSLAMVILSYIIPFSTHKTFILFSDICPLL